MGWASIVAMPAASGAIPPTSSAMRCHERRLAALALRVLRRWEDQEERREDSLWEAWEERLGRLEDIVEDGDERRKDSERGRARDNSRCW